MRKLLSANFSRLWRSKIFWVLEALSAIAGAVFYILAIINTKNIGENWYLASGNYYFFIGLVIVGAIMAVFSAFYIGSEYDQGTIRNKLNVGCTRNSIYLTNLIVVVTSSVLFTITHIAASVVVGLPFLGGLMWEALAPVGWRIPTAIVMLLCYSAVFTFIASEVLLLYVDIDHLVLPYRSTYSFKSSSSVLHLGTMNVPICSLYSTSFCRRFASGILLKDSHFCLRFPESSMYE